MPLTNTAVTQAKPKKKSYKLFDGGGLYLLVNPNSSKYWRLKYRFANKEKVLALGTFPAVSLAKARESRATAKADLRNGIDLGAARKQQKQTAMAATENAFENVAREWWNKQRGRWAVHHANRIWKSLEADAFPHMGTRPIADVQAPELLAMVRKVEARGALDVASRLLQRTTAIYRYAVQTGRMTHNPAADLKGTLATRKVEHRASLNRTELPALLKSLQTFNGNTAIKLALRLLLLTFVRPGELRGARWDEFDREARQWRVPAVRMKMKTEHVVPLSRQALALLDELQPLTGHYDLLFPGNVNRSKSISENTLNHALHRMGYKGKATGHGMRATASSILNEEGFTPDAVERQLAHLERNQVRGAYTHHAEYLQERTKMMQWWADYLDKQEKGSNVVPGRFGKTNSSRSNSNLT